jgi:exocyst complex component 4
VHDYLTDEEQGVMSGRNPISSINDVLREGRFSRDKAKHVFRFADTDLKLTAKSLREHEDELNRALRDTVPGLVQGSSETPVQATFATVGTDERLLGTDQHHRLLVKPDAFHITVLFQPMLSFIDRVMEILPSGFEAARASSAVLDDFVLKVYLPQLEEKVSLLFHQAVTGPEAFVPDASSTWLSTEPLVNASTTLMALINSLCVMLRTTPFHREDYARLILTVIIQFYQRCSDRFQALIASHPSVDHDTGVAIAAQWAQNPDVIACLSDLHHASATDLEKNGLYRRERDAESQLMADKAIGKGELISPLRNISALCNLYRSVSWFTAGLNQLKAVPEDSFSPTSTVQMETAHTITPFTPSLPSLAPLSPDEQLQLPLSKEMALRFHALLKTYDQLSEMILHTVRIDVRCRVAHYLDLAMRHGNYHVDREIGEPDPHIIDLNLELGEYHDIASTTLPPREQKFIFDGIGYLVDDLLIYNARYIRVANALGMKKMSRNMLALQQCVKSIVHDAPDGEFLRAKQYYSLFSTNPRDMLASIHKQRAFTIGQYEVMLNLQCGVDQSQKDHSGAQATDKNYSMYIIDLHGLEMEAQKDS